jgi:hypothetical protein
LTGVCVDASRCKTSGALVLRIRLALMPPAQTTDRLHERVKLCMLAVVTTQVVCVLDVLCEQLLNHVEDQNGVPSTA